MTTCEALAAVRAKRVIANPNLGFLDQLDEYHDSLLSEARLSPPPTKVIEIEGNVA